MNDPGATFEPELELPRSVYVHIPFCQQRCGYCNFSLLANRDHLIDRFLEALQTEFSWLTRTFDVDTVFLGGGTPSHLQPTQVRRLKQILDSRFSWNGSCEFTAECNPGDLLEGERCESLASMGVNRISLGVQSFDDQKLKVLERTHSGDEAKLAIENALSIAPNVSVDLIFAAPHETLDGWHAELRTLMSLGVQHVSTYELTFEKGTTFWNRLQRGVLSESDEDLRADMYLLAIEELQNAGFGQYEVSSFARPGHRCFHNLAYWNGSPYFAFGPGASRFIDGIRETNHQSPMRYMDLVEQGQSPVYDRERLEPLHAARERLAIGLRMVEGVDVAGFEAQTGHSVDEILNNQHLLFEHELVIQVNGRVRLTGRGRLLADWVSTQILKSD